MARGIKRGAVGGVIAALLSAVPIAPIAAQSAGPTAAPVGPEIRRGAFGNVNAALSLLVGPVAAVQPTVSAMPPAAPPPAKPTPAAPKVAAKPAPSHPAHKVAAAKAKSPPHKLATTTKPSPAKKVVAATAKKPVTPIGIAAAPEPTAPSVTTSGNVTRTVALVGPPVSSGARSVPMSPATTTAAAVPVSLTQPAPVVARPVEQLPPRSVSAPPGDAKTASAAFVANFLKEAFHLARLNGATSLQRRAQLAELFTGAMDVKRIAGYTTANGLAALSPEQQQRFRTILVSYLVETYYPQLELASDPSVKVDTTAAEPLADGTAVVWTTFTKSGWGSQSVKWQLANENGSYKIVDIFSAGASLVQMERDTFASVMRYGGLPELMAKLDARTKELATAEP